MNRKVFVSFLGTNNYLQTYYELKGQKSNYVRFIQEALVDFLCKDWTEKDQIIIFYTEGENGSEVMNWLDNGQKKYVEDQQIESIGLQTILRGKKLQPEIRGYGISEGFSEEEIWKIFDCVYDKLLKGDEIYFDITHAFRSIPMFSTVLFNYSRFMKQTTVKAIYYGAFEKLGPLYIVKNMKSEDRIAPILDLTDVARLQQYTDMANSLMTFGRIKRIGEILKDENSTISPIINKLSESINDFDNYLLTNRMNDIKSGKCIICIRNYIKKIKGMDIPTPIKNVINKLNDEMKEFVSENSNANIEAAINWAVKYKMLPQAYTLGQEYIISLLAEKYTEENPFTDSKKSERKTNFRVFISAVCSISDEDAKNRNYRNSLSDYPLLVDKFLKENLIIEVRKYFADLGKNRNFVNHAKGSISYQDFEKEFNNTYTNCLSIIKSC